MRVSAAIPREKTAARDAAAVDGDVCSTRDFPLNHLLRCLNKKSRCLYCPVRLPFSSATATLPVYQKAPCTSRLRRCSLSCIPIRYSRLAASTRAMLTEPVAAPMTESQGRNLKGSALPRGPGPQADCPPLTGGPPLRLFPSRCSSAMHWRGARCWGVDPTGA